MVTNTIGYSAMLCLTSLHKLHNYHFTAKGCELMRLANKFPSYPPKREHLSDIMCRAKVMTQTSSKSSSSFPSQTEQTYLIIIGRLRVTNQIACSTNLLAFTPLYQTATIYIFFRGESLHKFSSFFKAKTDYHVS